MGVDEQFAGKFQEAFDSFQKAAQLDPKFARAYTGMAAMAQNLGKTRRRRQVHETGDGTRKQHDRAGTLSRPRAVLFLITGDWQNCVQDNTQLVTHFPADRVGQ